MDFTTTINDQIKTAMKAGDKLRLEVLRSLRAGILEFEKSGVDREMTADDEFKIINAAAKKRKDAIEQYTNAGRPEAAAKEQAELDIIMEFLPAQMSADDVKAEIARIIADVGATGPGDFGKVMGAAMKTLKGKADGNVIQSVAKDLLAG